MLTTIFSSSRPLPQKYRSQAGRRSETPIRNNGSIPQSQQILLAFFCGSGSDRWLNLLLIDAESVPRKRKRGCEMECSPQPTLMAPPLAGTVLEIFAEAEP